MVSSSEQRFESEHEDNDEQLAAEDKSPEELYRVDVEWDLQVELVGDGRDCNDVDDDDSDTTGEVDRVGEVDKLDGVVMRVGRLFGDSGMSIGDACVSIDDTDDTDWVGDDIEGVGEVEGEIVGDLAMSIGEVCEFNDGVGDVNVGVGEVMGEVEGEDANEGGLVEVWLRLDAVKEVSKDNSSSEDNEFAEVVDNESESSECWVIGIGVNVTWTAKHISLENSNYRKKKLNEALLHRNYYGVCGNM